MASIKLCYCLLIMFSSIWIFTLQTYQDGQAGSEMSQFSKSQKEIKAITVKGDIKNSKDTIEGRKMAQHKAMKQAKAKEQLDVKRHEKDGYNGDAGLVAFNADYGAPRRHPPKNN